MSVHPFLAFLISSFNFTNARWQNVFKKNIKTREFKYNIQLAISIRNKNVFTDGHIIELLQNA